MKKLSKLLALLLALCMVLTVGVFASGEPSDASGEPSGDAVSVEEAYVDYIHEFLLNELTVNTGGMTIEIIENEFMPAVEAGKYDEFPADMLYNGMLDSGVAMTFEEFAAQYVPAEEAAPASGEAQSVEDAYADYLRDFLEAELEVNSSMMPEHVEEILAAALAGETDSFPGDILFNGMLVSGNAMTFDEFAAQYVPAAAPAAGSYTADEAGYKAYLKDWVAANPAVQANIDEFNAGIDAGAYNEFPMEMCFTDQWFGYAALTYDQFIAAGGVAEIPAFDPNLAPD